jgi:DNA polymerase elongation subunit (family B)
LWRGRHRVSHRWQRRRSANSLYGSIGNNYFRHYRLENAEAITCTGQVAIRWIERKLNEFVNKVLKTEGVDYVVASDTDSIYLDLGNLVNSVGDVGTQRTVDVLNKFCQDIIEPFISKSYDELSDYLNCYERTLVMKRECIAERGIWTAKKRYILNVWDNEGVRYEEPKLKMMGIEAVKSSTPKPCRAYIKESLKIIMEGTEEQLIEYIAEKRTEFNQLPPEEIAFPRTGNNISKFMDVSTLYKKGTPIHIRGCIMFNHLLRQNKLTNKYNIIQDGEKIRFIFLRVPNPTGGNIMSFITELPTEFDLHSRIDYDTMFQKSFIDPLQVILDTIGWQTEKQATLFDFFS